MIPLHLKWLAASPREDLKILRLDGWIVVSKTVPTAIRHSGPDFLVSNLQVWHEKQALL
jgi:hypothetical protein